VRFKSVFAMVPEARRERIMELYMRTGQTRLEAMAKALDARDLEERRYNDSDGTANSFRNY
jgi:hypothetical protein